MAATVTEQKLSIISGSSEGRYKLSGIAVLDGGTTSFVIAPGHNNTNVSGSTGITLIDLTPIIVNTTNANAFKAVKTQDNTNDQQIITVTGTANESYAWTVEGPYSGTSS